MKVNEKKLKKEAPKKGIKMIILFGSHAKGKTKKESDYDVAVLTTAEKNIAESMENYNDILFFLSDALEIPDYKLDLTNLNNASPFLANEIVLGGKLVYGDEDEYTAFRLFAIREYINTQDLRDLEKRMIDKRQKLLMKKMYA